MKKPNPDARTAVPGHAVICRQIRPLSVPAMGVESVEFRTIAQVAVELHDSVQNWGSDADNNGVRLYCTQSSNKREEGRWHLQVRAWARTKAGDHGKHFAIGTASMSREDLQWLRDQIDAELRRKQ